VVCWWYPKSGRCTAFLGGAGFWSPSDKVAGAEAYLHTKWHLNPSSRLATTDMGRKLGTVPPFLGGGRLGPHLTHCGLGRGLPARQISFWSVQPFGHNTPTSRTGHDRQRSDSIGEPFYKRSPKNWTRRGFDYFVRSRGGHQNWFRGQGSFNNTKFLLLQKFCWLSKIWEF